MVTCGGTWRDLRGSVPLILLRGVKRWRPAIVWGGCRRSVFLLVPRALADALQLAADLVFGEQIK
jgi:hypothetical protein